MIKYVVGLLVFISTTSCSQNKNRVDSIFINGNVNIVDLDMQTAEAFAINKGKIVAFGTNEQIKQFEAQEIIDLENQFVYPGFYDAHCHFLGYGLDLKKINLTGTKSFNEIIELVKENSHKRTGGWVFGRGWDQNDWVIKEYPNNKILNELFPDVPVYLLRIDGHAALVNDYLLNMVGITPDTKIEGGEILLENGKLTGVIIDNVLDTFISHLSAYSIAEKKVALIQAQKNCFEVGLTTVADAGLNAEDIELIHALQEKDSLKMNVYAMVSYNDENLAYYKKKGKIITDDLTVRSFKIYSDGALGSRGACLLDNYSDKKNHKGFLLNSFGKLNEAANNAIALDFQMNTHSIGDSAVRNMLNIYKKHLKPDNNKRWRIEHCQVFNEMDIHFFGQHDIIPSVQPTHATSDMYWAEERIGKKRMQGAYAYQTLLKQNNMLANGSDFPVESINPLYGFYAAISRKDLNGYPENGFNMSEALTREQALKAMTIWAAYACFEEDRKGSLEQGKFADFVVLKDDLLKCSEKKIPNIKIQNTYIKGQKVF